MTIALCIKCGSKKFGALCPCEECGFDPASSEEKAKSLLLSDHYYTHTELDRVRDAIKAGQTLTYDSVSLAEHVSAIERLDPDQDTL